MYDRSVEREIPTDVLRRAEWELGKQPLADALSMANAYEKAAEVLTATAADHAYARAVADLIATEKVCRTNAELRDVIEKQSDRMAYNYVADTDLPTSLSTMDRRRFGLETKSAATPRKARRPRSVGAESKSSQSRLAAQVVPSEYEVELRPDVAVDRALEIERNRAYQIAFDRERLWQSHRNRMEAISSGDFDDVAVVDYRPEVVAREDPAPLHESPSHSRAPPSIVQDLARMGILPAEQARRIVASEDRLHEERLRGGIY